MLASRQWNPQWDQAMRDKLQEVLTQAAQKSDQMSALMMQQQQEATRQLLANGEAQQAARNANHAAFMNQMNRQSEQNNENFRNYQAQRSLNSWKFNAYIRNGELYRDTSNGQLFEVDH